MDLETRNLALRFWNPWVDGTSIQFWRSFHCCWSWAKDPLHSKYSNGRIESGFMSSELKNHPYSSLEVPGWVRGPSEISEPGTCHRAFKSFGASHDGYMNIRFRRIYRTPPQLREKLSRKVLHDITWFLRPNLSRASRSVQIALKSFGANHDGYANTRFQGIYRTPPELRENLVRKVLHILTEFRTEDSSFAFWTRTQSPVRHTLLKVVPYGFGWSRGCPLLQFCYQPE